MARPTNAELVRRISALEAENLALRERVTASTAAVPSEPPVQRARPRGWAWTLLATALIAIGAILAPVAVVASWSRVALTDTDRFVATYSPLSDDPRIQAYITDQVLVVINEQVDIPSITADVIDGITNLGTGPAATQALELLKGPAASGIQSLIRDGVVGFVVSDAFADVWASALRVSHTQLGALLANDPDAAITVNPRGEIGIQLGPIVEAVKVALVEQGIEFAGRFPAVDRTIVIARSDALPSAQLGYGLALAAGIWLPWISLVLLAAGVLVARRRVLALLWAAVALVLTMALTLVAIAAGSLALVSTVSPTLLPAGVATLLYDTVAADMRATATAVLVLALVVAAVSWLAGPFDVPRRLRRFAIDGAERIRAAADERGLGTGRVGEWLGRRRGILRTGVAGIGAAIVLVVRPLTPALIVWTLVVAVVAIAALEVLQRPVAVPVVAVPVEAVPVEVMGAALTPDAPSQPNDERARV